MMMQTDDFSKLQPIRVGCKNEFIGSRMGTMRQDDASRLLT
jgi:hypothetical protein